MYLMVLVLKDNSYLNLIISVFMELGIYNMFYTDITSFEHIITYDIPIFFKKNNFASNSINGKLILGIVDDEEIIEKVKKILNSSEYELIDKGILNLFLLNIEKFYGNLFSNSGDF